MLCLSCLSFEIQRGSCITETVSANRNAAPMAPRKRALPAVVPSPVGAEKLRRVCISEDEPLDMSQRSQASRPSVITCVSRVRPANRDAVPSRRDVPREADPVVEAHFRRSLGSQYAALFASPSTPEASVTGQCLCLTHFSRVKANSM